MKVRYKIRRTNVADSNIHRIILYIDENFGQEVALKALNELEKAISELASNPYIGVQPRYNVLCRQGYSVLTTKKNLIFYKIDDVKKDIIIYAVLAQRQDYIRIIQGL